MNLIIGLGHRRRVGKDAFANALEVELWKRGYRVFKLAFATPLKNMAAEVFGFAGLHRAGHYQVAPEEKEKVLPLLGKSARQIWIEFGNAMRLIHPDVWVDKLRRYLDLADPDAGPLAFIITDVRYPNEAAAIKAWGGLVGRVVRDAAPYSIDVADNALASYRDWDFIIDNNGSLEDLRQQAKTFLDCLPLFEKEESERVQPA